VTISRAVPNIRSERPAETRDFFVDVLGFEVAMDLGWVVTVASPTNASAQVTIVGSGDMAAPGISVEVADVDAAHAKARQQGSEIVYPPARRGVGSPALHAPGAERHGRQRRVPPLGLSARLPDHAASLGAPPPAQRG
jgi:catechol 2,3-dioxygenase-like lactoylglutathione lyase family enzyme